MGMDTPNPSAIIARLGGTSATARLFNIKPPSVTLWKTKGIPDARLMYLRVARPDIFKEPKAPK